MDLHRCGDCQKGFDSFENFLIHKLLVEQYKITLEPSKRIPGLRLPKFIKSQPKVVTNSNDLVSTTVASLTVTIDSENSPLSSETTPQSTDQCTANTTDNQSAAEREKQSILTEDDVDIDGDDSISISSQTESLKIDESAKDTALSPLRESITVVDGKQKYYCKSCGKYYKNNVILRVHQETVHSVSRPFVCEYCLLAFKSKGSLVRHIRTHTGERPFKCKECNKAFHNSGSLSRHTHKLHSGLATSRPKELQVFITRLYSEDNLQ